MTTAHRTIAAARCRKYAWALAAFTVLTAHAQDDGTVLVVPVNQLDTFWIPDQLANPKYPLNAGRRREEGCATIGFIIEADGTTSSHQIITSWPDKHFGQPSLSAAREFTYRPAPENPGRESVYTSFTFTFLLDRSGKQAAEMQETLARVCIAQANLAGHSG